VVGLIQKDARAAKKAMDQNDKKGTKKDGAARKQKARRKAAY
jgi:hypothetical protein